MIFRGQKAKPKVKSNIPHIIFLHHPRESREIPSRLPRCRRPAVQGAGAAAVPSYSCRGRWQSGGARDFHHGLLGGNGTDQMASLSPVTWLYARGLFFRLLVGTLVVGMPTTRAFCCFSVPRPRPRLLLLLGHQISFQHSRS